MRILICLLWEIVSRLMLCVVVADGPILRLIVVSISIVDTCVDEDFDLDSVKVHSLQ